MKRDVIYGAVIVVLAACLYALRVYDHKANQRINSTVLSQSESAKVILNPTAHSATIVTRRGTETNVRTVYLPPHTDAIAIGKDGSVQIEKKALGYEHAPFIGFGYALRPTGYAGVNLLYVWRLDVGPAIAWNTLGVRPIVMGGYNVWSNTSTSIGYGPLDQSVHLALTVKL